MRSDTPPERNPPGEPGPAPAKLREALLAWYRTHHRPLPWRDSRDPYAIWVSEVMLQQTQVATVIPYWERFLARFPTVEALAAADLDAVLSLWSGLGYYSRARNLHRAAQALVERHDGALPGDVAALRALPGFGRYTAGAVASIAFGQRAAIVDGNVARVLSRLFLVRGRPGEGARERALWELAGRLVDGPDPGILNQSLMELGALVCRADAPDCPRCPVRQGCAARSSGEERTVPPPRLRPERAPLSLAVALWKRRDALLWARRPEAGLFGGLWELPAFPMAPGESAEATLHARLGDRARIGAALGTVERTLTHRRLKMTAYAVTGPAPERLDGYEERAWMTAGEVATRGVSAAMRKVLSTFAQSG